MSRPDLNTVDEFEMFLSSVRRDQLEEFLRLRNIGCKPCDCVSDTYAEALRNCMADILRKMRK